MKTLNINKEEHASPIPVLHLLHALTTGGLEAMVVNLVKKLSPKRFTPLVCCFDRLGELGDQLSESRIPVALVKRRPGIDMGYPLKLAKLLRKKDIQILHLHNPTALFYGTLAGMIAQTPSIIYTEHGRDHSIGRKARITNRILSTRVQHIVAVGEQRHNYLVNSEKIDKKKVITIFNGIDEEKFRLSPNGKSTRKSLKIEPDTPVIGIVARLDPIKNHTCLIQAMNIVTEKIPKVMLLVAGCGPMKEELENLAQRLGLTGNIRFLGNRSDIPDLLDLMDVYTLPSFNEGLSLTLIEACASSTPIVATDVGGNSEIVKHCHNGLLVPSNNPEALASALVKILSDKPMAKSMGKAGKKIFSEKFTLKQMTRAYEALYYKSHKHGRQPPVTQQAKRMKRSIIP